MKHLPQLSPIFLSLLLSNTLSNAAYGVSLEAQITGDFFHAQKSGIETGSRFLTKTSVALSDQINDKLQWRTSFHGTTNGGLSEELVGDALTVSNIDAIEGARIDEFWLRAEHGVCNTLFGLYDLNSEFDHIVPAELFINAAHGIGPDLSQSGENGPSIFPFTALALRGEWKQSNQNVVRLAVMDATPGTPDSEKYNSIYLNKHEGVLAVGEWQHFLTPDRALTLGAWSYSDDFEKAANPDETGKAAGFYASMAETPTEKTLGGWLRVGSANDVHAIAQYIGFGITGLCRDGNNPVTWGAAVAHAMAHSDIPDAKDETVLEFSIDIPLLESFSIQPDIQWIKNAGFTSREEEALVLGVRFNLSFEG